MATSTSSNLRMPDQLRINGGDIADNWQRSREQFENYVIADLRRIYRSLAVQTAKRAAVFLFCIGGEAFDVFVRCGSNRQPTKRKSRNYSKLVSRSASCVRAVEVQTYTFHRRMQDSSERFDVFLGDVRRLARSCQFKGVEDSMIRDRIVVGIHATTPPDGSCCRCAT